MTVKDEPEIPVLGAFAPSAPAPIAVATPVPVATPVAVATPVMQPPKPVEPMHPYVHPQSRYVVSIVKCVFFIKLVF